MTTEVFVIRGVNPVPWTSPTASIIRKGGKPRPVVFKAQELVVFQESIKEILADEIDAVTTDQLEVRFFLWRQIDTYKNVKGHTVRKHRADATNLQKALEDALQGVLYVNDNQIRHIETWVVEQETEIDPCIMIEMTRFHQDLLPVTKQPPGDQPVERYSR